MGLGSGIPDPQLVMKDDLLCVSSPGAGPRIEPEPYVLTYSICTYFTP
jgi:hypothetical protein